MEYSYVPGKDGARGLMIAKKSIELPYNKNRIYNRILHAEGIAELMPPETNDFHIVDDETFVFSINKKPLKAVKLVETIKGKRIELVSETEFNLRIVIEFSDEVKGNYCYATITIEGGLTYVNTILAKPYIKKFLNGVHNNLLNIF